MSLTKVSNSMIQGAWFSALDFGAVGDGSTNNKAAFQAAIDAMSAGDTLYVPSASSYYLIDATQTSEAVQVNKSINIIIDGQVQGSSSNSQANPPTVFYVTANDVLFTGSGSISGPGTYTIAVTANAEWASLISVSNADRFTARDITFLKPPQASIHIYSANFVTVTDCTFSGGPTFAQVAGEHQHANIYSYGGGNSWNITNNLFEYDIPTSGSAVQHILNSTDVVPESWNVSGNQFFSPHEHCTYLYINNSVVADNVLRYTTIAAEQQGNALKMGGDYNTITGNAIYNNTIGGIQAVSSRYNIISNNTIDNCGNIGISINNNTAVGFPLDGNEISSNYIDGNGTTSTFAGIRYLFDTSFGTDFGATNGKIIGNTILNYGDSTAGNAAIAVFRGGAGTSTMSNFIISDNIVENCPASNAIYATSLEQSIISSNIFKNNTASTFRAIRTDAVNNLVIENNVAIDTQLSPTMDRFLATGTDTNILLRNNDFYSSAAGVTPFSLSEAKNIWGSGNRLSYTSNLSGTFTLNNVSSLLVANSNILSSSLTDSNSIIVITPLNAAASTIMGSAKSLYVSAKVLKTSFTVSTADGASVPASDHIFAYHII